MNVKAIITGTTGMVGEGVLQQCLQHEDVEAVLVINRKTCGISHPKLKEIIHSNFYDLSNIENELTGYNACFFCLGVTSVGKNEKEYNELTYMLTMHAAETLVRLNDNLTFCYVSGAGTDNTEHGKVMWARVKGKTENHLLGMPFKQAYMFRPGYIQPTTGLKHTHKLYYAFSWLYPVLKKAFPQAVCTLEEIGIAMVKSAATGYTKKILEVRDIIILAHQ